MYCEDAGPYQSLLRNELLPLPTFLDGLVRTLNWKQRIGVDTLVYRLFADTIFSVTLLME